CRKVIPTHRLVRSGPGPGRPASTPRPGEERSPELRSLRYRALSPPHWRLFPVTAKQEQLAGQRRVSLPRTRPFDTANYAAKTYANRPWRFRGVSNRVWFTVSLSLPVDRRLTLHRPWSACGGRRRQQTIFLNLFPCRRI